MPVLCGQKDPCRFAFLPFLLMWTFEASSITKVETRLYWQLFDRFCLSRACCICHEEKVSPRNKGPDGNSQVPKDG